MSISVVIPCHNAAPYIAQTVRSVLGQTRPADEIVVMDDGSTDDSRRVVEGVSPGIRVFSRRCGSAARARLAGVAKCRGDAIMFLDADDVLAPDALAALSEALEHEPGTVAACPWYRLEFINGRWLRRPPSCARRLPGEDPLRAWLRGWYHPPCAILWSREAYTASGGWTADPAITVDDDGELMMRALARGIPLRLTPGGAAYYRRLPQGQVSLSGKRLTPEGLRSRLAVIVSVAQTLRQQGRLDAYRASLGKALRQVAADGGGGEPELSAECRAYCAEFGDPDWRHSLYTAGRRARARLRALRPSAHRAAPMSVEEPVEITYGLDPAG